MHIVFATTEFITERGCDGGLANYLAKTGRILSEHGHQVTIVVSSKDNKVIEYDRNIKVVRVARNMSEIDFVLKYIKSVVWKDILFNCWHSYKLNQKIKEIHENEKIDLVQYCHLSALGLFRTKKIPSVVRMSSFGPMMRMISAADYEPGMGKPEIGLLDKLDILAIKRADGVFAPSALIARIVEKVVGIKVNVLESPAMGMNLSKVGQIPDFLKGKKYFLFFGTLSNIKGLKTVVNSVHRILCQNPEFYFVFIGKDCGVSMEEGMKSPAVKKLMEAAGEYRDRILYLQVIKDRERLNSIIYHAELCILPYRLENLPNTCIEAMELGKIVISTRKSGIGQLIRDGYNGFLVEQNSPDALADKINEVLHMPDEIKGEVSLNAQKRIEKMMPEKFYRYMMQYYQNVIRSAGGKDNEKKYFRFWVNYFIGTAF